MEKVNLAHKFGRIDQAWHPRTVGELNGQAVKLVVVDGPFVWHRHEAEDELFLVVRGSLTIETRGPGLTPASGRSFRLEEGEFLIVPRGVEHRPVAESRAHVMLFEPLTTVNTGNVRNALTLDSSPPL